VTPCVLADKTERAHGEQWFRDSADMTLPQALSATRSCELTATRGYELAQPGAAFIAFSDARVADGTATVGVLIVRRLQSNRISSSFYDVELRRDREEWAVTAVRPVWHGSAR